MCCLGCKQNRYMRVRECFGFKTRGKFASDRKWCNQNSILTVLWGSSSFIHCFLTLRIVEITKQISRTVPAYRFPLSKAEDVFIAAYYFIWNVNIQPLTKEIQYDQSSCKIPVMWDSALVDTTHAPYWAGTIPVSTLFERWSKQYRDTSGRSAGWGKALTGTEPTHSTFHYFKYIIVTNLYFCWSILWGMGLGKNCWPSLLIISLVMFSLGRNCLLCFEVSGGAAASCNGDGFRWLRLVYNTDCSECIGLNRSDQHVFYDLMITHYSPFYSLCKGLCLRNTDKCVWK